MINLLLKKNEYKRVKESFESSFKSLTDEELKGLNNHHTFLEKVHREMLGCEEESSVFKANLEAFLSGDGKEFFALCKEVYIEKPKVENQNTFQKLFFSDRVAYTGRDLIPVVKKLNNETGNKVWGDLKNEIFANENGDFRTGILNSLIEGFSIENVTVYHRFQEAVSLLVNYLENVLKNADLTLILNLCKTNEKFVFILLYPYFLKPLGKIIWPTLLSHFHYASGSFTLFIRKVATTLVGGVHVSRIIQTLAVSKSFKLTVGIGSLSGLYLYNNYFTKGKTFSDNKP